MKSSTRWYPDDTLPKKQPWSFLGGWKGNREQKSWSAMYRPKAKRTKKKIIKGLKIFI